MSLKFSKPAALAFLIVAFTGFSTSGWTHEVNAGQSIGSSSVLNVDVYSVSCFTD